MRIKVDFRALILLAPALLLVSLNWMDAASAHTKHSRARLHRVPAPAGFLTPVYATRRPRQLTLDAQATCNSLPEQPLYCRFRDPRSGAGVAWLIFDPRSATVWTRAGYPRRTRIFTNVTTAVGLPPYGDGGFSLVAFGDVSLASIRLKSKHAHFPLFAFIFDHFNHASLPATWGAAPGGPTGAVDAGKCWVGQPGYHYYNEFTNW